MEVKQLRDARDGIAEEIRRRGFKQSATGVVERNKFFQEVTLVCAVAERSGQVFDDDAVDSPALHIPDHTLKVPPLCIRCAAGPVINVGVHNLIQAVLKEAGDFVVQNLVLVDHRFRDGVSVVTGQADVFANLPDHLLWGGFANR